MRTSAKPLLAVLCIGIAGALGSAGARAQNVPNIALKSGETVELTNLYFVQNCKSTLTSTPSVEILDGPPGVTASVKEDMVMARVQKCPAPVKGAKLFVTAMQIEDQSSSTLTLRITYKTRDGERKLSQVYNLQLFP